MSFISAFIIAIFGSILRPSIGTTAEGKLLELLFWCPAFILVVFLFRNIKKFKGINNSSLIWGFFSIVLPIFLGLFFAAIRIIIDGQNPVLNSDILSIISVIGLQLPFQMSHAAIIEEPVFRGFLWGTLNNIGWKENRIFILVFLMFILAHLSYIGRPFTFFFALPIITFFLNYIILKSHSITNSMIFHTVINTMTAVSYYLIAVFF
jgi:membrane protease YdiL (CAAX protease family)